MGNTPDKKFKMTERFSALLCYNRIDWINLVIQHPVRSKTGGLNGRSSVLYEMQKETGNGKNRTSHNEKWPKSPQRKMLCLWNRDV